MRIVLLFTFCFLQLFNAGYAASPEDKGTPFTNPVIWADVPDMSVTRVGDDFYMISTTMNLMPGAPVMKSKDLVHWEIVSYVFDKLTDTPKYDLKDGTVYGRGQWASSIRYHNGLFYVLFSPNDQPYKAYIYTSTDPAKDDWKLHSRTDHFHDASLFFDDDGRVYVFSGTGSLKELESDLSGVKKDGINTRVFERDTEETGLLEGSQVIKYNGKYYLLMISWPRGENRRQLCYRADNIAGPYEKKIILEDNFAGFPYAAQGAITDDANGNWYGLVFQDRNGVGRVPLLLPCRWVDGWPMLDDENGRVPASGVVPLPTHDTGRRIVESDDFGDSKLKINWQWNHNPVDEAWSLTERPGYLRLNTNRVVDNLFLAPNSITQRMEGPKCRGIVALDVSKMKDGDVAGLSAFNGDAGLLSVVMEGQKKYLVMSTNSVSFDDSSPENMTKKMVKDVKVNEKERIELLQDIVYLRLDGDFNLHRDMAMFHYSLDNKEWTKIGSDFKMIFDYRRLFMGSKFAIYNYATKSLGGYVDVDFFDYERIQ